MSTVTTVPLVCDTACRVACLSGHVFVFEPNTPKEIPEHAVATCRAAGCFPAGGAAPKKEEVTSPDPIFIELHKALTEIQESGDPNYLTASGIPRKSEVQKRMAGTFTNKQLQTAWDSLTLDAQESD